MALERLPRAICFTFGINVQHDAGDFAPISAYGVRVQQAQISDDVFLIVNCQFRVGGAVSATSGLSGGFCMGVLSTRSVRQYRP